MGTSPCYWHYFPQPFGFSNLFARRKSFWRIYLNQLGFGVLGLPLAWFITFVELLTLPIMFFANLKYRRWLCAWLIVQIFSGIVVLHSLEGWFVVGSGRNGSEYSFLIIASLFTIAFPPKNN